jgi:hypothetical protein
MFLRSLGNLVTGYRSSWYNIVGRCLLRDLTLREDRFPAISGIVSEVTKQTAFTYRAWIWLEDIHRSLAWYIDRGFVRTESYIAPSWSWGSIKAPINRLTPQACIRHVKRENLNLPPLYEPPVAVKLITCNVVPRGKDPFGQLTYSSMVLRGLWLPFSKWRSKHPIRVGASFGNWFRQGEKPWTLIAILASR